MTGTTFFVASVLTGAGLAGAMQGGDVIDWGKIVAGAGAAGLIAVFAAWVIRHFTAVAEKRDTAFVGAIKDLSDTVKDANARHAESTKQFATTIESRGRACDETTTTLLREARASHEARENKLIEVLKEVRRP